MYNVIKSHSKNHIVWGALVTTTKTEPNLTVTPCAVIQYSIIQWGELTLRFIEVDEGPEPPEPPAPG